jgi:hypothetical protein
LADIRQEKNAKERKAIQREAHVKKGKGICMNQSKLIEFPFKNWKMGRDHPNKYD